jgi:hypothetical protein
MKMFVKKSTLPCKKIDKIINEGYCAVSIAEYVHTTGIIMRDQRNSKLIGYCNENPLDVLEKIFLNYPVVKCEGYQFYGSNDFEKTTPMKGLAIGGITPVYGINGNISEMLDLDSINNLKRKEPIQKNEIEKIIKHLIPVNPINYSVSDYAQQAYNLNQIAGVLKKFIQ